MARVVCVGDLLIDFVPTATGTGLADAPAFVKAPGGAAANVAVGLARLGVPSAFVGMVGDDAFGHFLADTLAQCGVDVGPLRYTTKARTALAFVLEFLAGLAATAQRPAAALRLGGAADALRESLGATLAPQERAKLERRLDPARATLGTDAAEAAWQAGRDLPLDEAVALAARTRYVT